VLYARHLGWLHCIPNKSKVSRLENLEHIGSHLIDMPEVGAGSFMLEYFYELMGGDSYTELKAWTDLSGIRLTAWQAATLKAMMVDYAIFAQDKRENSQPPYDSNPPTRDEVSVKMKDALNHLRKNNGC